MKYTNYQTLLLQVKCEAGKERGGKGIKAAIVPTTFMNAGHRPEEKKESKKKGTSLRSKVAVNFMNGSYARSRICFQINRDIGLKISLHFKKARIMQILKNVKMLDFL